MITLEHVSKGFAGGSNAVRDLSLEIPTGQTCVLLGPSGCGKTTTLRMINRLTEPDGGRILVDGVDTQHVDPVRLRLKMGYVIQQTGLFPHMTVADNVATVPRLWEWDAAKVKARVDELLELVGLPPREYRKRYPHQLSGGQRQIGRASCRERVYIWVVGGALKKKNRQKPPTYLVILMRRWGHWHGSAYRGSE